MSRWEKYLEKIYFNPSHPASFEGPTRLYKYVKKKGKFNISHNQIKNWIQRQNTYSRNKKVKRNFQRSRVIVSGIDDQFDADLADLRNYADENDGYQFLLVVIDVFSRYAWVEPIKNKTKEAVVEAMDKILSCGRIPRRLRTDRGSEFTADKFQNYMTERGIKHFTTYNEKQANYVERFIRTIKSKIYRYTLTHNDPRYIDVLPRLVKSYNRTWHSGIQSEPINVNRRNEKKLWWQMYYPKEKYQPRRVRYRGRLIVRKKKPIFKYKVGDKVRITHTRSPFDRAYDASWTAEIFTIHKRYNRHGIPVYRLVDWSDDPVKGTYYQAELQKVDTRADDLFKIDHVIKYKGKGKRKQALVHWMGWRKKFDSWVDASTIVDYKEQNKKRRKKKKSK